jgi:xylan 1,4-beta-xylosidase
VIWNPNNQQRASQDARFQITLPATGQPYTARTLLLDEQHANPYRAWEMLGRERNPSPADVELLREASRPLCRTNMSPRPDGSARLDLTLTKNAVQLVQFIPVEDHTPEYYSLDREFYANFSI